MELSDHEDCVVPDEDVHVKDTRRERNVHVPDSPQDEDEELLTAASRTRSCWTTDTLVVSEDYNEENVGLGGR